MLGLMNGRRILKISQLLLKVVARALGAFVASLVTLLTSSAQTSSENEATTNAASGGMLNYRTGKLDDGTDPAGMYEKD